MSQTDYGRLGLGPIDQVAFVVHDLEAALPRYEAIYGPFTAGESVLEDYTCPDGTASCTLKLAVNNSSPVEIELIEVVDGNPPHKAHLEQHGEGLHHVRFRVDSLAELTKKLEAEGFETLFHKRFGPGIEFSYMTTPEDIGGSIIELLEMPPSTPS